MSAPRRNVAFTKPGEPSFIKAFKQHVGYKAPDTVEAKRTHNRDDKELEDREDKEDEKPTIVVLNPGDLTKEEAEKTLKEQKDIEEPADGRVVFTKPSKKRKGEDSTGGIEASTKRTKSDKVVRRNSLSKKVKDTSLLSFDDNDETFN